MPTKASSPTINKGKLFFFPKSSGPLVFKGDSHLNHCKDTDYNYADHTNYTLIRPLTVTTLPTVTTLTTAILSKYLVIPI